MLKEKYRTNKLCCVYFTPFGWNKFKKKSEKIIQRIHIKMGKLITVPRRNNLLSLCNGHKCEVYARF